jgi:hypothetical protein
VVETIRLESGHTLTGIVGSNPTLSAISNSWFLHVSRSNSLGKTTRHGFPSVENRDGWGSLARGNVRVGQPPTVGLKR